MIRHRIVTQCSRIAVCLGTAGLIALASPTPAAAQTTATYTGPANGVYNDPANWDIGVVPINDMVNTFNVVIPPNITLDFGLVGTSNITGLSLGDNSTIRFIAGESLQVDGVSIISGIINASGAGAEFLSPSQFAAFTGTKPEVFVADGANVAIAASQYAFTQIFCGGRTILSADGTGSILDLASLLSISGPSRIDCGGLNDSILATNGGVIDLSNVVSIAGAGQDDWLRFLVASTGDINLSSLTQTSGRVWFDIDVPAYTLPSLDNTLNTTLIDAASGSTVTLPVLTSFVGNMTIANGAIINAPIMTAFTSSTLAIADGGALDAPLMSNVSGSVIDLNPNRMLTAATFSNIDNARIFVSAGSVLGVTAPAYAFNSIVCGGSGTLLSADGTGSRLNFGSLGSITGPPRIDCGAINDSIVATNGGVIDFSNVVGITGAGQDDYLRFLIDAGGVIDLSALTQISGRTRFSVNVPNYTLPSLTTASSTWFDLGIGVKVTLPNLTSITGSANAATVPVFAELDVPALTSINGDTIDLQPGGTINAPSLTTLTHSSITLSPSRFLVAPALTNIDDSRIMINGGSVLGITATAYVFSRTTCSDSGPMLSSDGPGSRFNFASLVSITGPSRIDCGSLTDSIVATNGGVIDLSNLIGITGAGQDDYLLFHADNGGVIVFGNVSTISGRTKFELSGTNAVFNFQSLTLNNTPSLLTATLGATVSVRGDYSFQHAVETSINLSGGVIEMNGTAIQRMEIGGMDNGIPTGTVTNNFEIGQLIVGQTTQATTVELVDAVNNGNRGTMPVGSEALYLQGFTQGEGSLRILGGSTLVIGNLNVYATDANQTWFRVNDLFPVGVNTIPFDGGFIALTSDCNSNMIPDDQDILNGTSVDCNGNGEPDECEPDCNANGVVDACDVNPLDPDGNGLVSTDCDGNGVPDECEPDCNANGVVDACDVDPLDPDGNGLVSPDCDGNGVPDECDPDCNANGTPDACETFTDCNVNGIPDSCELVGNDCNSNGIPDNCDTDCNNNGTPDACETITDCNADGIPDECQLPFNDCNANLIPDDCDIAAATSQDCNTDGIPDDCQLAGNDCNADLIPDDCQLMANDCNTNSIPDECEADCNANGTPDQCDITAGTSQDCDTNGVPDDCQLAGNDCNANGVLDLCDIGTGTSLDCDGNGIPDECDAFVDCNANGINDPCDIASGTSADVNGDSIPDECQVVNITQGTAHATIAAAIATANDGDDLLAAAAIFGTETTIDYTNKAVHLSSSASLGQPAGGSMTMAGGGRLSAAAGQGITLGGSLTVPVISDVELFGTPVSVEATGSMLVASAAGAAIHGDLVNSGAVTVQGGTLAYTTFRNNVGGTLKVFGGLSGALTNNGNAVYVADAQVVGDYVNNGATTVQNGVLTIIGSLTNNGTIVGDVAGGAGAAQGLAVLGNFGLNATAQLLMPGNTQNVKVDGNLDIAINDNNRFDMAVAELRMIGLGGSLQELEVMSEDIGPNLAGLNRTLPGHYPIGTLRLGPTPTTVQLVDNRDNDNRGQAVCEALYVNSLIIDPGASLVTNNCLIYYRTLTNNGAVDNPTNLVQLLPSGNIPTVSTWGIVVLFLLVLTTGTLVVRCRARGLSCL